jgi:hypothetical protein
MSILITRLYQSNHYIYTISNTIQVAFNLDNTIDLSLSKNVIGTVNKNITIDEAPKYFNMDINLLGYIISTHLMMKK